MTYLPDVNVWIALAFGEHVHHISARAWAAETGGAGIAFCRVTQMGFMRLLTNERVMREDVLTASEAWDRFSKMRKREGTFVASEPPGLDQAWRAFTVGKKGASYWTDAYLAAFAQTMEYKVVTFDRGFRKFRGVNVEILETAS